MLVKPYTTIQIENEPFEMDGTLAISKALVIRCSPDVLEIFRDQAVQSEIEQAWNQSCSCACASIQAFYDVHPYYLLNPDSLLAHLRRILDV